MPRRREPRSATCSSTAWQVAGISPLALGHGSATGVGSYDPAAERDVGHDDCRDRRDRGQERRTARS